MLNKDKLATLLSEYKADFSARWKNENYKWVAIKTFQDNWDIDAKNFYEMLKASLSKTGNLLASAGFFPAKMILLFAEKNPEQVRKMFRNLFDESLELTQRIEGFKRTSDKVLEKHKQNKNLANHYQTENTIYFDNTELFNKVENYAKDNPLLFNYNDFYQQHYFEKFYSRYPEVR